MAASNPEDVRMSLGDHLDDLRKRIFLGAIGPIIAGIVLLLFRGEIVTFLSKPAVEAFRAIGEQPKLVVRGVGDAFGIYIRVAIIGGLIIGIPWLLYQLWMFIAPGLYPQERKFVTRLIPGSVILSTIGVVFAYYVVLPFTLWFLIGFANIYNLPEPSATPGWFQTLTDDPEITVTDPDTPPVAPLQLPVLDLAPDPLVEGQVWLDSLTKEIHAVIGGRVRRFQLAGTGLISTEISLSDYISFVMWMELGFAVASLVHSSFLRKSRKFAFLICFFLGAVFTPPDPTSMVLMAVPLYLLYEFGLILMARIEKRREEADANTDADTA